MVWRNCQSHCPCCCCHWSGNPLFDPYLHDGYFDHPIREELYVSNIDELLQIDRLGYTILCCTTSDVLALFDLLQCLRWCLKPFELVYQLRQLEHCMFSFVLVVRVTNVFVDQVIVHLDTIYCLIYAKKMFVGGVVLSRGSTRWVWALGPKQWCLLIQF